MILLSKYLIIVIKVKEIINQELKKIRRQDI